jgi:hypothetical protein
VSGSIQFCGYNFGAGARFCHFSKEVILLWGPSVAAAFDHVRLFPLRLQSDLDKAADGFGTRECSHHASNYEDLAKTLYVNCALEAYRNPLYPLCQDLSDHIIEAVRRILGGVDPRSVAFALYFEFNLGNSESLIGVGFPLKGRGHYLGQSDLERKFELQIYRAVVTTDYLRKILRNERALADDSSIRRVAPAARRSPAATNPSPDS